MKESKYWRFKGSDFIKISVDYLYKEATKIVNNIDESKLYDTSKTKIKESYEKALAEYNKKKYTIKTIEALSAVLYYDQKDWSEFSLNPNSKLEDIIIRAAVSSVIKNSIVCICYVCENNININEDFINDLMYVTSNMFNYKEFNDTHVNAVLEVLDRGSMYKMFPAYEYKPFADLYGDNISTVTTKVNFKYMNTDIFSKEFLERHKLIIDKDRKITQNNIEDNE